jgi:alkylation response protein AidB-like acyl-CoA dehydrogenase
MHFGFTNEQLELQKRIREFVEKEIKPGAIERDESRIFPYEIISKLAAQGYSGLPVPKEYGGQGKGYQELAIVIEEISKVDVSVAVAISVNISLYGGTLLYADATPEQ